MIVDLCNLPHRQARELILWCVANNIDKERAKELYFAWYESPPREHVWELDIPEEHMLYFMLKWEL